MKFHNLIVAAIITGSIAGCGVLTPAVPRDATMTRADNLTTYKVTPRTEGFELLIYYEKPQYESDLAGLATSCKSALTSLAYDLADQEKRQIKQINEQRIKLETSRHVEGMNGIDFCKASVPVEWK